MSGHPCAGHACDHCYVCDVVGVCCASQHAPNAGTTDVVSPDVIDRFRDALAEDNDHAPRSLGSLSADAIRSHVEAIEPPEKSAAEASRTTGAFSPTALGPGRSIPFNTPQEHAHEQPA